MRACFWGVVVYIAIAVLGSVATTLYGRPPAFSRSDAVARVRQFDWCLRELSGLRDELESAVSHEMVRRDLENAAESYVAANAKWQQTFEMAASRCGSDLDVNMADAYSDLRVLHQAYSSSILQWLHARSEIAGPLGAQLRKLAGDASRAHR